MSNGTINLAHLGMTFWAGYTNVRVIFYLSAIVILLAALFLECCLLIKSSVSMTFEESQDATFPFTRQTLPPLLNPTSKQMFLPLGIKGFYFTNRSQYLTWYCHFQFPRDYREHHTYLCVVYFSIVCFVPHPTDFSSLLTGKLISTCWCFWGRQ